MDQLRIEPMKGIGLLRLGMSQSEVEDCLQIYTDKYEITYEQNPLRYHDPGAIKRSFQVEYDAEGRVNFIQICSSLKDVVRCTFETWDVFNMKAEELVDRIDQLSKYERNGFDLGFDYYFPELNLSFWRPVALSESDLQENWFKELAPAIQEDEKKNLYFECVSIKC
ncbi:hypothetical protein FHS18_004288 [Paenibacillus phyllosphaerae]|uniref:Uncharacterized protein n=1 Tax=Paenibacillus phyllosphaerae TaxID=274593 RepID=A0A7W5B0W3_9BACL|nr:hypothetical protein [Paenibacillus phyllosphaerae]MBB3112202.1 hypothetical protein [Paenibacillus phyllosphaerae]